MNLWHIARQLLAEHESKDALDLRKLAGKDLQLLASLEVLARYPDVTDDERDLVLSYYDRQPSFLATTPWHRYPIVQGRRALWVKRHLLSAGVRITCHIGDALPSFNNRV